MLEGGMRATATLLKQPRRPTAIMRRNDMTAIGVMRQSYEEKISIPRELSVIGFDDIRLAQFILPPLTTVQMSQAELGAACLPRSFDRGAAREASSPRHRIYSANKPGTEGVHSHGARRRIANEAGRRPLRCC